MKRSIWKRSVVRAGCAVVLAAVLVVVLNGCDEAPGSPDPTPPTDPPGGPSGGFNPPSPPGPTVSVTDSGMLEVPGATIVSDGKVHDGSAPTANAGLMGVKVNGHVYLYHPDLGDVQLSEQTSDLAVQYAIYGGAPGSRSGGLQVASASEPKPGTGYRKTATGMNVRRARSSPGDHYTFENTTVLWHTVVSQAESQPTYFAPKSILGADWTDFEFYLERREARDVQVDGWDVELYRDLLRGSFSSGSLVAAPVSIAKYKAAVAAGADPQVFVKMVPIVLMEEMTKVLQEVFGLLPFDQCFGIIVDPLLAVAESHLIAMFTNEGHRIVSFTDALIQSLPTNGVLCLARVAAAVSTGATSEVVLEMLEKIMLLKWAAYEVMTVYDTVAYDAYATVPGLEAGKDWSLVRTGGGFVAPTGRTGLPLYSVAFGNRRFVAVGRDGTIVHSSDGDSWQQATNNATSEPLRGVAFGNGRFVAVGGGPGSTIVHSSDGDSWQHAINTATSINTATAEPLRGVAFGNGRFVAVGLNGTIVHSSDGDSWQQATNNASSYQPFGVAFGSGRFVAVGIYGSRIVHSSDGDSWQQATNNATSNVLYGVGFGNEHFVAVGLNGTIVHSSDGDSWQHATNTATSNSLYGVGFGNERFVAVGSNGAIVHSSDGSQWEKATDVGTPKFAPGNDLFGVAWSGERFVAVGYNGTIVASP